MHVAFGGKNSKLIHVITEDNLLALFLCRILVTLIGCHIDDSCISKSIQKNCNRLYLDWLLFDHSLFHVINNGLTLLGVFLLVSLQLGDNHLRHGSTVLQNIGIGLDVLHGLRILLTKCLDFQTDQAM